MKQVRKFLEVSTANVPAEIAEAIDGCYFARKPTMSGEYGWLFHVPEDLTQPEGLNSKAFDNILALAQDAGCDYVLFDRDTDVVDWLPTFDW